MTETTSEERHATWTELFYDLIFVVAVAQVAHGLSDDVSVRGVAVYAGLFTVVWWVWIGHTIYADRFDSDDLLHRGLTGLQMLAIASIALFLGKGVERHTTGFVLSFLSVRLILILCNLRVYRHVPASRPLLNRYVAGYSLEVALWASSLAVGATGRYWLWAIAITISMAMPFASRRQQSGARIDSGHLTERIGLFTIIVLGEAILSVVDGAAAREDLAPASLGAAALAFAAVFSIWWIYFDAAGGRAITSFTDEPRPRATLSSLLWVYIHIPFTMALAAFGVGVEHIVAYGAGSPLGDADRWLVCGAAGAALVGLGLIHVDTEGRAAGTQAGAHIAGGALMVVLALVGSGLKPLALTGLIALICAVQVAADLSLGGPRGKVETDLIPAPTVIDG